MTEEPVAAPQFIDNPHAPEVFATDACGFFRIAGNIITTFETWAADHGEQPGPARRVVVGRLVLPVEGAQRLAVGLHDFLTKQGFDPTASLRGDDPVQ